MNFLFTLVNDWDCRENSLNQYKITEQEHEEWFFKTLQSEMKTIYILMHRDRPVGQGGLEEISGTCRISYSIILERWGCGYGRILMQQLGSRAGKKFPKCKYIYGQVVKNNVAFQKIFGNLGYSMVDVGNFIYYKKMLYSVSDQADDRQEIYHGADCLKTRIF